MDTEDAGVTWCVAVTTARSSGPTTTRRTTADLPQNLPRPKAPVIVPGTPLTPPPGQRCRGRNYDGRRCCTPEQPCGEGEGDCDGAGDGGINDGNRGCRAGLVCGSNNCKKFGAYYHEKDDCCERPDTGVVDTVTDQGSDWGP